MSLRLKKILRTGSKIVLVLAGLFLVGYFGYITYLSVRYKPMKVRVTNVTGSSATVSWVTDYPMDGVVYYGTGDSFLPGPLSWIGKEKAWDDRDVSFAETECVKEFNKDVGDDFSVSGEDFNCNDVKVTRVGNYYTHHVTLKNLDESTDYHFRVGDGVWSWDVDVNSVTTFSRLKNIEEPKPLFGKVVSESGNTTSDTVVYVQFRDGSESTDSIWMSSVANGSGGWYLDGANIRDESGNVLSLELSQDMFKVRAQYMSNELGEEIEWVFGYFNQAYPDIVVDDLVRSSNVLSSPVMARLIEDFDIEINNDNDHPVITPTPTPSPESEEEEEEEESDSNNNEYEIFGHSVSEWNGYSSEEKQRLVNVIGAGNAAKLEARTNGGVLTVDDLDELGLGGDAVTVAGNMSAIFGGDRGFSADELLENPSNPSLGMKKDFQFKCDDNGFWSKEDIVIEVNERTVNSRKSQSECEEWDILNEICLDEITCGDGFCDGDEDYGNCREDCHFNIDTPICGTKGFNPSVEYCVKCGDGVCSNGESADNCSKDCSRDYFTLSGSDIFTLSLYGQDTSIGRALKQWDPDFFDSDSVICIGNNTNSSVCDLSFKPVELDLNSLVTVVLRSGDESNIKYVRELIENRKIGYESEGSPYEEEIEELQALLDRLDDKDDGKQGSSGNQSYTDFIGENILELHKGDLNQQEDVYRIGDVKFKIYWDTSKPGNVFFEKAVCLGTCSETSFGGISNLSCVGPCPDNFKTELRDISDLANIIAEEDSTELFLEEYFDLESSRINTEDEIVYDHFVFQHIDEFFEYRLENGGFVDSITNTFRIKTDKGLRLDFSPENKTIYCSGSESDCAVFGGKYNYFDYSNKNIKWFENNIFPLFDESITIDDNGHINVDLEEKDSSMNFLNKFIQKTYAQETSTTNSSYFYLPEYGFYTLSMEGIELGERVETDENTIYLFYVEANGIEGFQIPEDVNNPQAGEDIVLQSDAFEIEYEKVSNAKKLNLKKGVNVVSFEDVLALRENKSGGSAMDLILWARERNVDIETVTYFEAGRWSGGVHCDGDTKSQCSGVDFEIVPGKGYLMISGDNVGLDIPVYDLQTSVPISFSAGWNLVGIHGYSQAYTARTLIDSINEIDGLTADNITWYPTSKGKYEGLQVTDGEEYGLDYPINTSNGYFVRINEYEPQDSSCKSLIWHDGGDLNGSCGNSKSIL